MPALPSRRERITASWPDVPPAQKFADTYTTAVLVGSNRMPPLLFWAIAGLLTGVLIGFIVVVQSSELAFVAGAVWAAAILSMWLIPKIFRK